MEGYSGSYSLHDGGQSVGEVMFDGNGTPTLYAFDGFGASGLEWRSFPALSGGGYSAYTFDPQGNVVQPVTLYPGGNGLSSLRVRTSSSYDGFGLGVTAPADGSGMADPVDPVGFGGQFGYYHDYTTGLYLLTHRYYDVGAGRFINRDPIGYRGGINLYGFAGNNPVNRMDPEGTEIAYSGFSPAEKKYVQKVLNALRSKKNGKYISPRGAYLVNTADKSSKLFLIIKATPTNSSNQGDADTQDFVAPLGYTAEGKDVSGRKYRRIFYNPWAVSPSAKFYTDHGPQPISPARFLAHELGHVVTGTHDSGPTRMDNINQNENPALFPFEHYKRTAYKLYPK